MLNNFISNLFFLSLTRCLRHTSFEFKVAPGGVNPKVERQSYNAFLSFLVRLPVDDALGRQLVAEVTHTGKKKEATIQCCLEGCRMLEARGLLRQEAGEKPKTKRDVTAPCRLFNLLH